MVVSQARRSYDEIKGGFGGWSFLRENEGTSGQIGQVFVDDYRMLTQP